MPASNLGRWLLLSFLGLCPGRALALQQAAHVEITPSRGRVSKVNIPSYTIGRGGNASFRAEAAGLPGGARGNVYGVMSEAQIIQSLPDLFPAAMPNSVINQISAQPSLQPSFGNTAAPLAIPESALFSPEGPGGENLPQNLARMKKALREPLAESINLSRAADTEAADLGRRIQAVLMSEANRGRSEAGHSGNAAIGQALLAGLSGSSALGLNSQALSRFSRAAQPSGLMNLPSQFMLGWRDPVIGKFLVLPTVENHGGQGSKLVQNQTGLILSLIAMRVLDAGLRFLLYPASDLYVPAAGVILPQQQLRQPSYTVSLPARRVMVSTSFTGASPRIFGADEFYSLVESMSEQQPLRPASLSRKPDYQVPGPQPLSAQASARTVVLTALVGLSFFLAALAVLRQAD